MHVWEIEMNDLSKPRTILERMRDDADKSRATMLESIRDMIARHAGLAVNAEGADGREYHKQHAGFLTRMLREYLEL